MTTELAFLVPVLGRPHQVKPLLAAIEATTPGCRVLFLSDPKDIHERRQLELVGAEDLSTGGNYAHKIRRGVEHTTEPLIFTGADDLEPQTGWFEAARAHLGNGIQVVGINDLIPRLRVHTTHFLMTREYAEQATIDNEPGPFFDGYAHWFCDDEFIATAKHRGVYAYAKEARVRHLHPMVGEPDDNTYRKGRANRRHDGRLFRSREHLWMQASP